MLKTILGTAPLTQGAKSQYIEGLACIVVSDQQPPESRAVKLSSSVDGKSKPAWGTYSTTLSKSNQADVELTTRECWHWMKKDDRTQMPLLPGIELSDIRAGIEHGRMHTWLAVCSQHIAWSS